MEISQNGNLTKWKSHKMEISQNGNLTKWKSDEIEISRNMTEYDGNRSLPKSDEI